MAPGVAILNLTRRRAHRLAIIGLALVPLAAAGRDDFRVEYFDLHGNTARELRADLSRKGPVGETGVRGDGYTEYRIAWRYQLTSREGSCHAQDVEVDLDVRMVLPRWNPPPNTRAELIAIWERFSAGLREHEDGHHRLAVAAAQEVRRKLRSRAKAGDCQELRRRLDAAANEVLRKYRKKQADFDTDTDFGRAGGNRLY